jgi:hypothetical protein
MAGQPVILEVVPTSPATVSTATATREGEELVISGTVRKPHRFHLPGHVDIVVCGPDGTMLGVVRQHLAAGYLTSRGGAKTVRFTARLHLTPPPGSTVRLRYHAPPLNDEDGLGCAEAFS